MEDLDALVDAARSGGRWAFGRLWEELSPTVTSYLRARGARDPDDTTSEVFLAAFRGIGRFEGDGSAFRSWLFTIAHHKSVDGVRRAAAGREVLTDDVSDERTHPSAEDDALQRLGDDAAQRLLATLSPDQCAVMLLRVVADLSLEDTARVLGKPLGAVKSLQHRALAGLRRALAPEEAEAPVSPGLPVPIAATR